MSAGVVSSEEILATGGMVSGGEITVVGGIVLAGETLSGGVARGFEARAFKAGEIPGRSNISNYVGQNRQEILKAVLLEATRWMAAECCAFVKDANLQTEKWFWYCVFIDESSSRGWRPSSDYRKPDNLMSFLAVVQDALAKEV